MTRGDIVAFARREWALVEAQKARFWAERKGTLSPTDAIRIGDELRRHAWALRPGWPRETERAEDLTNHLRVAEALRAVHSSRAR